jgi:hypothetical protein
MVVSADYAIVFTNHFKQFFFLDRTAKLIHRKILRIQQFPMRTGSINEGSGC